jgi:hypothetical protein
MTCLVTLTVECSASFEIITTAEWLQLSKFCWHICNVGASHIEANTSQLTRTMAAPASIEPGFGAPLQQPLPGPVMERESTATPSARHTRHCVN